VLKFWRFLFLKATLQRESQTFKLFCDDQCLPPIGLLGLVESVVALLAVLFGSLAVLSWHTCASPAWDMPQGALLNDALCQSAVNCSGKRLAKPQAFTHLLQTGSVPNKILDSPFDVPRRAAGGQRVKGSQPPLSLAILCAW